MRLEVALDDRTGLLVDAAFFRLVPDAIFLNQLLQALVVGLLFGIGLLMINAVLVEWLLDIVAIAVLPDIGLIIAGLDVDLLERWNRILGQG